MILTSAFAALCAAVLLGGLLRLACRHRGEWWITSDDAILCVASPILILLVTFGGAALGYRLTHGGLAAVAVEGWIGAAAMIAASIGLWHLLARRIRNPG